jgi:transposase-like protein
MSKDLGISKKSAWFLLQRIRQAMRDRKEKLSGIVEIDETFIGGKNKNRHYDKKFKNSQGRSLVDKCGIYGFVERNGRVRTIHLRKMKGRGMRLLLTKFVETNSVIHSDEYRAYIGLDKMFKEHHTVNHGIGKYVDGDNHTNTIESFWSGLKKGITSTYHSVSKHKLFRYCYEFEFRWNTRKENDTQRFNSLLQNSFSNELTWKMAVRR